jgi:arylsulfatase A-like enzyme
VGEILAALKREQLENETLVVFSSDNGPWLLYGNHAGSAQPLREGKATSFDGGVRVPFIARWPGHIPSGTTCREPAMTIDLLPTIARLAGASPPTNVIDGRDIWPLLKVTLGPEGRRHILFIGSGNCRLCEAARGSCTLVTSLLGRTHLDSVAGPQILETEIKGSLFNLANDPREINDVAEKNPAVVQRLLDLADKARFELGDSATGQKGNGRTGARTAIRQRRQPLTARRQFK